MIPCGKVCDISKGDGKVEFRLRNKDCIAHLRNVDGARSPSFFCEILTIFHSNRDARERGKKEEKTRSNISRQRAPTSYSLTLHWHQMRMASICGDIIFMPDPEGRVMPSSRATPACVAMPPRFEFLQRVRSIEDWNARKCPAQIVLQKSAKRWGVGCVSLFSVQGDRVCEITQYNTHLWG